MVGAGGALPPHNFALLLWTAIPMSRHLAYTQPCFSVFEHIILVLFASKVVLVILLRVEGGI